MHIGISKGFALAEQQSVSVCHRGRSALLLFLCVGFPPKRSMIFSMKKQHNTMV